MAEVPISLDDLEDIVTRVVNDVVEKMIIVQDVTEDNLPDLVADATELVTFVIDRYMDYFNSTIAKKMLSGLG